MKTSENSWRIVTLVAFVEEEEEEGLVARDREGAGSTWLSIGSKLSKSEIESNMIRYPKKKRGDRRREDKNEGGRATNEEDPSATTTAPEERMDGPSIER